LQTVPAPAQKNQSSYAGEIEQWRSERVKSLTSEDGWLSLAGLFWLNPGKNKFGSDPSNEVVLPAGKSPRFAGSIWLEGAQIRLEALPNAGLTSEGRPVASLTLKTDAGGKPTVLEIGSVSFHAIKRGDRFGVRVKDRANPARSRFGGLDYFPIEGRWKLEARFEPYNPPKKIPILNILGMVEEQTSPGAVVFAIAGKSYRLDALGEKGSAELFIIFADETNVAESYRSGRYIYTAWPDSYNRMVLDFNKAFNPPCAFTAFATCPLPPRQNRLPIRIEAGEKKYGVSVH
jgi:uncharacterized protein (DUF1684 family)